jgi:hypothetical protein
MPPITRRLPRIDPLAVAILFATATAVRAVLGYRPFPSIDDFTYIPLGWARLDPELFPRDEMLRGALSPVPFWPPVIWLFQKTVGLAEGLFLLTLILTFFTVYVLRRLVRSLGGSDFFLPLVVALSVTVNVRGIGRGTFDGVLGDAFHMQWLGLALVLLAYEAFVREKPLVSGAYLGAAAWVHPVVAFHGAFGVTVAGVVSRARGLADTVKTGLVAMVVSLPISLHLVREMMRREGAGPTPGSALVQDTLLFRTPHHYDLHILPFLFAGLLGLVGVAAIPRIADRGSKALGRFYGLLLGQALLLSAAFVLHGPYFFRENPPDLFFLYTLDLSRTTPLFFALCGIAAAAALPGPKEPLSPDRPRGFVDRVFAFSAMLAVACLLLINLKHDLWIYSLLLLTLLAYTWVRRGSAGWGMTLALFAFAGIALWGFLREAEVRAFPGPTDAELHSWARSETPKDALFIIPPSMEAFRLEARRSVYVDFKLIPPSLPALAQEGRRRLEEVANPDAKALEQARGWPGLYWWDLAYAKRNPPSRIVDLLTSTGADFFVQDRVYLQLPPHLPSDQDSVGGSGLDLAFENSRYRVYRLEARP